MKRIKAVLLACLGVCFGLCVFLSAAADSVPSDLLYASHPFVDRIYDVKGQRFITRDELVQRLLDARYVLLGESHDNSDHHDKEAWLIERMAAQDRPLSVSFEMIDDRQGEILADRKIPDPQYLINLLRHVPAGWDYEVQYRRVFAAALTAGLPVLPANIERTRLVQLMHQPVAELPAPISSILQETALSGDHEQALLEEIILSHCGMLDEASARPMIGAQRIRDAAMTASLINSGSDWRLLIAGNGHVRNDRGVPVYLTAQEPETGILAVSLMEVEPDHDRIADYQAHFERRSLPYDYIWFTPHAARGDPCADWGDEA